MYLKLNSQKQVYTCEYFEDTSSLTTNINIRNIKDFSNITNILVNESLDADVYSDEECTELVTSFKDYKIISFNMIREDGRVFLAVKPNSLQKEIINLKDSLAQQEEQISTINEQINPTPIDPSTLSLEEAKTYQLDVVNKECTAAIHSGIDVETSQGMEHFSLTEVDQLNITALHTQCVNGVQTVPYHADGKICREFTAEEMIILGTRALEYIIYCTTYCNHIRAWINRLETVDEVIAIHFTSNLPEDLQQSFYSVINGSKTVVNEENDGEVSE